jgi:hypothetical protein
MPSRTLKTRLSKFTEEIRRLSRYAGRNWIREMPRSKRIVTWIGYLLQGYAIYCLWSRSLARPLMWPEGETLVFLIALLLYFIGGALTNVVLTSEFVRKTQLEADQIAAR